MFARLDFSLQWYQWEILHLSVLEDHEGKGLAKQVYGRAEQRAIDKGVKLLQCTIREGNERSEGFVTRRGFVKVSRFKNDRTGNTVGVWQKVLAQCEAAALAVWFVRRLYCRNAAFVFVSVSLFFPMTRTSFPWRPAASPYFNAFAFKGTKH